MRLENKRYSDLHARVKGTFPIHSDERGKLFPINCKDIPFEVRRTFLVYDVPMGDTRGHHAHHRTEQLLACLAGSIRIKLTDRFLQAKEFILKPGEMIQQFSYEWAEITFIKRKSMLQAICSTDFDEKDYIRNYDEFLSFATRCLPCPEINSHENLSIKGTIALVGSSPNILKKKRGSVIDKYDNVVRFNHAQILGMEEDSGSKTTHLVINCHVYQGLDLKSAGFEKYRPDFWNQYSENNMSVVYVNTNPANKDSRGTVPKRHPFHIMPKNIFDEIQQKLEMNSIPTVGCAFIAALLLIGIKPDLFGFSTDESDLGHYFENRPRPSESHKHSKEWELLKSWEAKGLVRIFK